MKRKLLIAALLFLLIPAIAIGGATFSKVKTWSSGETLTASDLNAEFDNILNNLNPAGIDDESSTATVMQTVADPYPGSVASLATSLQGELQRLRYVIKQITGETYWYIDPDIDLASVVSNASYNSSIWNGVTNLAPSLDAVRDKFESLTQTIADVSTGAIIWRMINQESDGDNDPLGGGGTDWEISDDSKTEAPTSATLVTEASGIFSFESTGYWLITLHGTFGLGNAEGDERGAVVAIHATDDYAGGATWGRMAQAGAAFEDYAGTTTTSAGCHVLLKIEDVANDKVKFSNWGINANTYVAGSGTENVTYAVFMKLRGL